MKRLVFTVLFLLACGGSDKPVGPKPPNPPPPPPPPPANTALDTVFGRIIPTNPALDPNFPRPAENWKVTYDLGVYRDSSLTLGDGSYRKILPDSMVKKAALVKIFAVPPQGSRYGSLYAEVAPNSIPALMTWAALPKSAWILQRGKFRDTVSFDIEKILTALAGDSMRLVRVEKVTQSVTPAWPGTHSTMLGWNTYPIRYGFDRSGGAISAADSAAAWDALDKLNTELGFLFFSREPNSSTLTRGILLKADTTVKQPWETTQALSLMDPGVATSTAPAIARVRIFTTKFLTDSAYTRPGVEFGREIIQRSALEAYGLGHRCDVPSLMCPQGPNRRTSLTAVDAAMVDFLYELRRVQLQQKTIVGILERLNGLRVIERGLSPLSGSPLP